MFRSTHALSYACVRRFREGLLDHVMSGIYTCGIMTVHEMERIARVPEEMRAQVLARVSFAKKAVRTGSAAVLVAKFDQHLGATDSNVYDRQESNGTLLFAIIRGGECVTMMRRRVDQQMTPMSMRVDRVLKVKGA